MQPRKVGVQAGVVVGARKKMLTGFLVCRWHVFSAPNTRK